MKISLPFFVFETLSTINSVLRLIFRDKPENLTWLWGAFIPRKIETIKLRQGSAEWAVRIKFWSNGVYIDAVSEGCADIPHDQYKTVSLKIRAKRINGYKFAGPRRNWCEFEVPISDILQAENNSADRISEDQPEQVEARKRQTAAIKAIHNLLK